MSNTKKISIIVPCFNEAEVLPLFIRKIKEVLSQIDGIDHNILFVDDGSTDNTLALIKMIMKEDGGINYISFSRNFGKEAAFFAGLKHVDGDLIAIIDADLQDPPELIKVMYKDIISGEYDAVIAKRKNMDKEPLLRALLTKLFYRVMKTISDVPVLEGVRDFRLMTRQFVDCVLQLSEYNRFSKGIFSWVGFRTKYLLYENRERAAGKTKWSFWKLFVYSISGITSFSAKPIFISSWIGLATSILSFLSLFIILIRAMIFGDPVAGWPSTIAILLLMGGIQLLSIGILGEYLSKTYSEVKKRPIYLIKEKSTEQFL